MKNVAIVDITYEGFSIKGDTESVVFTDKLTGDSFEFNWSEIFEACDLWRE